MSEAFDAADVLQFDHVDPMSHDAPRLGEVSGTPRRSCEPLPSASLERTLA
jgi:hypothetical protein